MTQNLETFETKLFKKSKINKTLNRNEGKFQIVPTNGIFW